ncbi:MAG: hypothetical protein WBA07_31915 [Rivularia sp. (in: cyanobacteria)]
MSLQENQPKAETTINEKLEKLKDQMVDALNKAFKDPDVVNSIEQEDGLLEKLVNAKFVIDLNKLKKNENLEICLQNELDFKEPSLNVRSNCECQYMGETVTCCAYNNKLFIFMDGKN